MPSITRKSRHNRTERREEVTERLRDAVEQLLDSGERYTEISVERLVKEADFARSTFYVYFTDKADFLQTLTGGLTVDFLDAARAWLDLPAGSSFEDLRGALDSIFRAYQPHRRLMAAVVESASYDPGVRTQYQEMIGRFIDTVAQHIRTGQSAGHVDATLHPERTAGWITWMFERGLYELVAPVTNPREASDYLDALTEIIWKTLYVPARPDA